MSLQWIRRIDGGGEGEVWLARDTGKNCLVAVKLLIEYRNSENVNRFFREIKQLLQYRHRNIVRVFNWGNCGSQPCIVMEYLPNGNLEKYLSRPLEPRVAVAVALQIADALKTVHRNGGHHRDVKPANILIAGDGSCKLADFGLGNNPFCTITFTWGGGGTPGYVAPEVVRGAPFSEKADIYSFGATLFHMVTGLHPLDRADWQGQLDPSLYTYNVPTDFVNLTKWMTSPHPSNRPHITEVSSCLERLDKYWTVVALAATQPPKLFVLRAKPNPLGKSAYMNRVLPDFVVRGELFDILVSTHWHPNFAIQPYHVASNIFGNFYLEPFGVPLRPTEFISAGSVVRVFAGMPPSAGELFSLDPKDKTGFHYSAYTGAGPSIAGHRPDAIILKCIETGKVIDAAFYSDTPRSGDIYVRTILAGLLPQPWGLPRKEALPMVRALLP